MMVSSTSNSSEELSDTPEYSDPPSLPSLPLSLMEDPTSSVTDSGMGGGRRDSAGEG